MTRHWKSVPTSIRSALEMDKAEGIRRKRMSVERLAELYAVRPSVLYKWMEDETMPVNRCAAWVEGTGGKHLVRFLAVQAGGLFIDIPTGRKTTAADINALQSVLNDAVGALLSFNQGAIDKEACVAQLMSGMEGLAFHRENVMKGAQPELEFGDEH